MNRLSQLPTLRIDPAQEISLNYDGKICRGVAGDTVATALYASGVRIFPAALNIIAPGDFIVWTANAAIPVCR